MIESLAEHGVIADDLVPALMTTHTVANPEYDPEEARRKAENLGNDLRENETADDESISDQTLVNQALTSPISEDGNKTPTTTHANLKEASPAEHPSSPPPHEAPHMKQVPVTTKVLKDTSTAAIPGVTTSLSSTDENVTLDIRWTVLCDLFLVLIADSVYDARSRVLLEQVALKLGLGWLDVVKFESRVTEALEIQEDVETLEQEGLVEGARKAGNKRRYMMLGLATLGVSLSLTSALNFPGIYDTKHYRRWACYWPFCRSPRTRYRTWFSGSSFDSRNERNRSLFRRNSRCHSDHHRWCSDRLWNCSSWYDQSDATSEDL